jgi:hypothetical protein
MNSRQERINIILSEIVKSTIHDIYILSWLRFKWSIFLFSHNKAYTEKPVFGSILYRKIHNKVNFGKRMKLLKEGFDIKKTSSQCFENFISGQQIYYFEETKTIIRIPSNAAYENKPKSNYHF